MPSRLESSNLYTNVFLVKFCQVSWRRTFDNHKVTVPELMQFGQVAETYHEIKAKYPNKSLKLCTVKDD